MPAHEKIWLHQRELARVHYSPAVPALLAAALLVVVACGPAPRSVTAAESRAQARAAATGAITGTVIDAETGAALAMVELTARTPSGTRISDLSDSAGRYRLGELSPGTYQLRARWGELALDFADVAVLAGIDTEIVVRFEPRAAIEAGEVEATATLYGAIEGTVRDGPRGEPFPGVLVTLVSAEDPDAIFAMADESGRFEFRHLRPGRYQLSCYYHLVDAGNIEVRRGNVEVERGQITRADLVLDFSLIP